MKLNFPALSIRRFFADMIENQAVNAMKFTPFARWRQHPCWQGLANTVTLPQYAYIGDAADVAELDNISHCRSDRRPPRRVWRVRKVGKGRDYFSDEGGLLSGYGDPVGEIGNQLLTSLQASSTTMCSPLLAMLP